MLIRAATPDDSLAISALISTLTKKYIAVDFSDNGKKVLLKSIQPEAIDQKLASDFQYHVAEMNEHIIGVVGIKSNQHLYHLFVAEANQRRGAAKQLWQTALTFCLLNGNPGHFTVNSSIYALPLYKKLGFKALSDPVENNGIIYIPMELTIDT